MSFLSVLGKDFKAVFSWLGSSNGQAVVAGAESVAVAGAAAFGVAGPVQGGISLLNKWIGEAVKVEALSAAAGQQTGSGTVKAAAVMGVMVPELATYLQGQGITGQALTDKATNINQAVVNLLNLMEAPAQAVVTASSAPKVGA